MWPFKRTTEDEQAEELLLKIEEVVKTKPDQIIDYVTDSNGDALSGFIFRYDESNGNQIILMVYRDSLTVRLKTDKLFDYKVPLSKSQRKRVNNAIAYLFREKMVRALDRKFN